MSQNENQTLSERIAVVTGASSGIGRATARSLARAGASLVLNARREEPLNELVAEIESAGGRAIAVAGDACEQQTIERVLDTAKARFRRDADLVVINAGRGLAGSPLGSDDTQWEEMIRINLLGAARLVRAAGKRMVDAIPKPSPTERTWLSRPRDIVLVGSTVGRHISPFSSMYGSTKFGVHSIGEAVRRELAPHGIRVAVVAPGLVRSEFQGVAGYDAQRFGEFMDAIGPILEPEDVARQIAFMVSQPAHVALSDLTVRPTRQEYP